MKSVSVIFAGWLFALGLGLGGMTNPNKILGFLDIFGAWDPSLLFVMGGAVGVTLALFPRVLRLGKPVLADVFHLPVKRRVDWRLLSGAALFGIGWGLSGFCPGPAVVSLVTFKPGVLVFVLFMCLGLGLGRWLSHYSKTNV